MADGISVDVDEYLSELSERDRFSGSVLVRKGGKRILNKGYGAADREEGRPNTPRTAFQTASISKQFAAASVLLLQEQGSLSVRDRICAWLPQCPDAWEPITVHHLLTHTSGIGHWEDFPDLSVYEPNDRENLIRIFQREPLKYEPGRGGSYSSPGYVLIAHIVERVSGEPYARFLASHIFQPLGMVHTGAGSWAPAHDEQAIGYAGNERARSFELDTVGIGAGDAWSTTEDMERWDLALSQHELLSGESVEAMLKPHVAVPDSPPDIKDLHYGYAWYSGSLQGHRLQFHPGGNAGFVCLNAWLPDDGTLVILLSNDDQIDGVEISTRVVRGVLGIDGDSG